jgi:Na+/H+-translocating membrane pyrophosphatase
LLIGNGKLPGSRIVWRIALLLVISPAIPVIAGLLLLGDSSLMFAVTYPFFLASITVIAPIFHIYIAKNRLQKGQQIALASMLGLIAGAGIAMLAFGEETRHLAHGGMLKLLLMPMCAYGMTQALVAWALYTYGPLRVVA